MNGGRNVPNYPCHIEPKAISKIRPTETTAHLMRVAKTKEENKFEIPTYVSCVTVHNQQVIGKDEQGKEHTQTNHTLLQELEHIHVQTFQPTRIINNGDIA